MSTKHVVLIAGEASGDHHGAELVKELKKESSAPMSFSGIGGSQMQAAGVTLLSDLAQYGVTGLTEVLKHFRSIKQAFRAIQAHLLANKPDLLILIDYPGFNLRLAKFAKQHGIKILYYISPQIWAWKAKRIHTIKANIDMMAVILPFEKKIYQEANVPVRFVGHPLLKTTKPSMGDLEAREQFKLRLTSRVIGLLPGSRKNEVSALLPKMINAAKKLKQADASLEFIIPIASSLKAEEIQAYLGDNPLGIKCVSGQHLDIINVCHSLIVASGTASLEAALLAKPMVIVYHTNPLTYLVGRAVIKVRYLGLCNLLADKMIVPELIQSAMTADAMANAILDFLNHSTTYQHTQHQLLELKHSLGEAQQDCRLSQLVIQMLHSEKPIKSTQQLENKQYFID